MSKQRNVQLVSSIYEAFDRGDIPAILNCLDPEAELVFEAPAAIPWGGNRRGPAGWSSFFQTLGQNLEDVTFSEAMKPFAAQDDRVVFLGRYAARVKSTGARIDTPLVHLWTLRDGKVIRCIEVTNTALEASACTIGTAAV
jgi:ketosteroid isomerase-like protein